jgi:hypothetical protein
VIKKILMLNFLVVISIFRTFGGCTPPYEHYPKIPVYYLKSCFCSKIFVIPTQNLKNSVFLFSVMPFCFSPLCQAALLVKKATKKQSSFWKIPSQGMTQTQNPNKLRNIDLLDLMKIIFFIFVNKYCSNVDCYKPQV